MINDESLYYDTAAKAALARRHRDESTYRFHRDWFHQARMLETAEDRAAADAAWERGYKDNTPVRKPEYFL